MKKTMADAYLAGLKAKLKAEGRQSTLDDLARATGASESDIARLRAVYPKCPHSLIGLLGQLDGTYFRKYRARKVSRCVLGSDIFEFPYYLLSAAQIVADATSRFSGETIRDIYGDEIDTWLPVTRDPRPGQGHRDDRIDPDIPVGRWLHFADCMNNGGSSKLFIDFNPRGQGAVGQVIRFLHDPDSYAVIADSFDAYLQNLMDDAYSFLANEED